MTDAPRFVRFMSPFWFGMQGYFDEQDGTVIDITGDGRPVLVSGGEVNPGVPYVGVVHTGSVLPVAAFDAKASIVAVRLPKPWDEVQDGLPLDDPAVIVAADSQDAEPRVEAVAHARAREIFPGEFEPATQDDLDRWANAAED